jgi:hypothetical protein
MTGPLVLNNAVITMFATAIFWNGKQHALHI